MHAVDGAGHLEAAKDQSALEKAYMFLETELQVDPVTPK
jgi:hypothetical protein